MSDIVQSLRRWTNRDGETTPLGRAAADEIERLRALVEDAVETLEAMDLHTDNPLYDRLRAAVEV